MYKFENGFSVLRIYCVHCRSKFSELSIPYEEARKNVYAEWFRRSQKPYIGPEDQAYTWDRTSKTAKPTYTNPFKTGSYSGRV